MSNSEGFLWRKYEAPAVITPYRPGYTQGLFLWRNADTAALPELFRWQGLGRWHLGFASRDTALCHALVYDLQGAMAWLWGSYCREFNAGPDAAEFGEMVRTYLLGSWLGDHTPYFFTAGEDLNAEIGRFVKTR